LGWCYQNGDGVPKDLNEAIRLFQLSVNQGNSFAQNNLGMFKKNEAIKLFQLSVKKSGTDTPDFQKPTHSRARTLNLR